MQLEGWKSDLRKDFHRTQRPVSPAGVCVTSGGTGPLLFKVERHETLRKG